MPPDGPSTGRVGRYTAMRAGTRLPRSNRGVMFCVSCLKTDESASITAGRNHSGLVARNAVIAHDIPPTTSTRDTAHAKKPAHLLGTSVVDLYCFHVLDTKR